MISLDAAQQAAVGATSKSVLWLFETSLGDYWSTAPVTFDGQAYAYKVIPDTFAGLSLTRATSEIGLQAPNTTSFSVTNKDNGLAAGSYAGETVQVALVINDVLITTWKFYIKSAMSAYQKISFACEDFLQAYLANDYPTGPLVQTLSSTSEGNVDDICVPVFFGNSYVPLQSIHDGTDRWYVMGSSTDTYTVTEVHSPAAWKEESVWTSTEYTFQQKTVTVGGVGYRVLRPVIMDSDGDGTADATGLWERGGGYATMPAKMSRSMTATITNPAEVIALVLADMGIPFGNLDVGEGSSFAAAAGVYAGWGLEFHGGWWKKQQGKKVIAQLLSMCNSTLRVGSKVELHVLSKAPVASVDKADVVAAGGGAEALKRTGSTSLYDYGHAYVDYVPVGVPQEITKSVPVEFGTGDGTTSAKMDATLITDNQDAQRAAMLRFARQYGARGKISFAGLGWLLGVQPDDTITVDDSDYGGITAALVDSVKISKDLTIRVTCSVFTDPFRDWEELSPASVTVVTEPMGSVWVPLYTDTPIQIGRFPTVEPGSNGLWITGDYIGYYNDGWKSYICADGRWQFDGDDDNFIQWDGLRLQVKGEILVQYGDILGDKPAVDADATQVALDAGAAIDNAKVNGTTLISGGYIRTNLLHADVLLVGDVGSLAYASSVGDSEITSVAGGKITTGKIMSTSGSYFDLDGADIFLDSVGKLMVGNSSTYVGGVSNGIWMTSGSYGVICSEFTGARLRSSSLYLNFLGADFYPSVDQSVNIGTSSKKINAVYAAGMYTTASGWFDVMDDLAAIDAIEAHPQDGAKTNLLTVPREITNYDVLKAEIQAENGDLISDEDFDALLLDDENLGYRFLKDISKSDALNQGAIRQLNREVTEDVVEQFNTLIETMIGRISKIEAAII